MFSILTGAFILACAIFSIIYLVPIFNRLFSYIWEDGSDRQRAEALKRLKELYVDGEIPEEVAVLLASNEISATEKEFRKMVDVMGPDDLTALVTGKKSTLRVVTDAFKKSLRENTGRR